jgi:hypothetical protein
LTHLPGIQLKTFSMTFNQYLPHARFILIILCIFSAFSFILSPHEGDKRSVTVPFVLDHNRMIITGEIQKKDGSWRKVRLWVDSGNPDFFMSGALAADIGTDLSGKVITGNGEARPLILSELPAIRIGDIPLDLNGIRSRVLFDPKWIFASIHIDATVPSTILKQFHVIIDYPAKTLTLAYPGSIKPKGRKVQSAISSKTGIVQIDALAGGDSLSFAFDIGASYSYISDSAIRHYMVNNPKWHHCKGAVGYANIWGWWPEESSWEVVKIPEVRLGTITLENVGIAGMPDFFDRGISLPQWYSRKTARPVAGFLGPNAFRNFRIELDYSGNGFYLEKTGNDKERDMDIAGITFRMNSDSSCQVVGIPVINGKAAAEGIEPGDILLKIDSMNTSGRTMGCIADALRGKPGQEHLLVLERNKTQFKVPVKVERFL